MSTASTGGICGSIYHPVAFPCHGAAGQCPGIRQQLPVIRLQGACPFTAGKFRGAASIFLPGLLPFPGGKRFCFTDLRRISRRAHLLHGVLRRPACWSRIRPLPRHCPLPDPAVRPGLIFLPFSSAVFPFPLRLPLSPGRFSRLPCYGVGQQKTPALEQKNAKVDKSGSEKRIRIIKGS